MAIKGKGKTKTGRRPVARGPRPGYVEPPKPLYKRAWFRWAAGAVAVAAVAAIVVAIVVNTSSNDRKAAQAARKHTKQGRVQKYAGPVAQYLQAVAQPVGGGAQVVAFQDLPTQLQDLQSGKLSPADAKKAGTNDAKNAKAAYGSIQALDVAGIASGFPDLVDLIDSQTMLVSSLQLYEQAGNGLAQAADATGADRQAIIARAQALVPVASKLFTDGYQKLINAQIAAGLPPTVYPAPSASPTPAASASPQPSPSPAASPKASGNGGGKKGGGKRAKPSASAS
jgi:hypothetical protein